jgi:hypothetical protein
VYIKSRLMDFLKHTKNLRFFLFILIGSQMRQRRSLLHKSPRIELTKDIRRYCAECTVLSYLKTSPSFSTGGVAVLDGACPWVARCAKELRREPSVGVLRPKMPEDLQENAREHKLIIFAFTWSPLINKIII